LYNSNLDSEQTLLLEYVNGISDGLQDLLGNIESSIDDWGDMLPDKVKGLKMAESEQLEIVNKFKNEMHSLLQEYKDKIKISKQDTAKGLKEELEQKSQEIFRELKKNITQIRTEVSPSISPIDLSASLPLSGSSIGESFMIINLGIYTKEDGSQYDCQYITLDKSAQAIGPLPPPGQVGARGVAYQVYTNNTELAKQLLAKKIGPGSY
jgi:ElaB/YqjD/DUF883 family membrane-anchored ribosome-binding protein